MGSPASFATERDGGSVAPLSRGSCAEGGSAGRGQLIHFRVVGGLIPRSSLQATPQISVLGPLPSPAWKIFAAVARAVNFALQKYHLPKTRFS